MLVRPPALALALVVDPTLALVPDPPVLAGDGENAGEAEAEKGGEEPALGFVRRDAGGGRCGEACACPCGGTGKDESEPPLPLPVFVPGS